MTRRAGTGLLVLTVALALAILFVLRGREASVGAAGDAAVRADAGESFAPIPVRIDGRSGLTLSGVVKDAANRPVPGATVALAAAGQSSLANLRCGFCRELLLTCPKHGAVEELEPLVRAGKGALRAAAEARADGEGRFRFEGLVGVSFTVWGRAPGLGVGVRERAAPGDPVELILPGPRAVSGTLRSESGAPVAGSVWIVSERVPEPVASLADDRGRFVVDGLGEGPFTVLASAPGLLPGIISHVEAGGAPLELVLRTSRALEAVLLLDDRPVDGRVMLRADHLERDVDSRDGRALVERLPAGALTVWATAGALVSPVQALVLDAPRATVTLRLGRGGSVAALVLDEAGEPVPSPALELVDSASRRVASARPATGALVLLGPVAPGDYVLKGSAEGFAPGSLPVQLTSGEVRVELQLAEQTVLAGRVLDEYGRPAPGVSVLVTPTGDNHVSDAEGRFVAPVPSPGLYTLHAHHSDWGGGSAQVQAPRRDVVLALEPRAGAAVTVTLDGRRVEGASAFLLHAQGHFRSDRPSGADGVVLMRGLPPDKYELVATHPRYLPSERQPLTLAEGQLLQVTARLTAGAAVRGVVVDDRGAPLGGVRLGLNPPGAPSTSSDGAGRFEFAPLRPKSPYAILVLDRDFEQGQRTVATAGGEPVRLVLTRNPLFRGRVLGEGRPLQQFRVDDREVSSPDGRFELSLPASEERVIVSVEAPGFEPLIVDRPRAPELGDFELRRAPVVSGLVREESGAPVADAVVGCDACDRSVTSGPDGRFSLPKPPYQSQLKLIARKGRRSASAVAEVGSPGLVELVLKPNVRISGVAYEASGRPAAGIEISAISADRSESSTVVTDATGHYALEMPPGSYSFLAAFPEVLRTGSEPGALIADVSGEALRLDFGPAPGTASLAVRVPPRPGFALWLVRGALQAVGSPPLELLRAPWAQLRFQPTGDGAVFHGLTPGVYTVIYASFHGDESPPVRALVQIPLQSEIDLGAPR